MPDSSSMKAPKGWRRATLPLWREPTRVLVLHRLPRVGHGGLAAEPELALVVDLDDLDLDLRALLEDLVQPGAAIVARLRHVDEALDAAGVRQGDERAPLDDLADDAHVEAARLQLRELLGADLLELLVQHLAARDDDVAALLGVLRDDEVEPLADEVAQIGAVVQVDVRGRREGAEAAQVDLEPALDGARDEAVHGLAALRRRLQRLARLVEDDREAREHQHAAADAGARDGGDELIALHRRLVAVGELATIEEAGGLARDVDPHRGVGQLADLAEDLLPDAEGRPIAVVARGAAGALLLPGRLAAFAGVLGLTLAFVLGGLVLLAVVLLAFVVGGLVLLSLVRLGGRGGALGARSSALGRVLLAATAALLVPAFAERALLGGPAALRGGGDLGSLPARLAAVGLPPTVTGAAGVSPTLTGATVADVVGHARAGHAVADVVAGLLLRLLVLARRLGRGRNGRFRLGGGAFLCGSAAADLRVGGRLLGVCRRVVVRRRLARRLCGGRGFGLVGGVVGVHRASCASRTSRRGAWGWLGVGGRSVGRSVGEPLCTIDAAAPGLSGAQTLTYLDRSCENLPSGGALTPQPPLPQAGEGEKHAKNRRARPWRELGASTRRPSPSPAKRERGPGGEGARRRIGATGKSAGAAGFPRSCRSSARRRAPRSRRRRGRPGARPRP